MVKQERGDTREKQSENKKRTLKLKMFVKIIIGLNDEVRNLPSINFRILKEMQNMTEKTKDIRA